MSAIPPLPRAAGATLGQTVANPSTQSIARVVGTALTQTEGALKLALPQADRGVPLDPRAVQALFDAAQAVQRALLAIKTAR